MSVLKYIIGFLTLIFSILPTFAGNIENVFVDVKSDYKYYDELQYLYDKGVFIPDTNNKFNPQSTLQRDEFVGSVMELSCDKCIHPNSSINYVLKYQDSKDIFYDITKSNPYFYCIAGAKEKKTVQGYGAGYTCSNGTTKAGSVPFCPENSIQRQEAIAVLLRNANILTLEQANAIKYNSFEPYLQKALETQLTITKANGTKVTYKLLEKDANGNTHPEQYITKEEFLKMSFVISKIGPCSDIGASESTIAGDLNIYDKSCDSTKTNCESSPLKDPSGTYDFKAEINTTCAKGVKQYKWIFYNAEKQIIKEMTGEYINNYTLDQSGSRNIRMIAEDNCGGVTESYSTIYVGTDASKTLSTDIIADPIYGTGPLTVNFSNITSGCDSGCKYSWDFKDGNTSTSPSPINTFTKAGVYEVLLTVEDKDGNKVTSLVSIKVASDASIGSQILVYNKDCSSSTNNCTESSLSDATGIYDFKADVETTCLQGIKSYNWTLFHVSSNTTKNYTGEYLDNATFDKTGTWQITLTVYDNCGRKTISQTTIEKNISTNTDLGANIKADKTSGTGPLNVNFESIAQGCTTNCSYSWDFGDGTTSNSANPNHNFTKDGTYPVVLTVTDSNGKKVTSTVNIYVGDATLGANIKADKTSGTGPLNVNFESIAQGCTTNCSYSWDFGDGTTSNSANPNHNFTKDGTYPVVLTVTDSNGKKVTSTVNIYVGETTTSNTKPSVVINADPIYGNGPLTVDFQTTISNCSNCSYSWDFKDGTTSTSLNPTHTFSNPGAYIVEVTVTDNNGDTAKALVTINVTSETCVGEKCNKDIDFDGITDVNDKCINVPGIKENDGCPILDTTCSNSSNCKSGYSCDTTKNICVADVNTEIVGTCIYPISRSSVFGNTMCNTCPCNYEFEFYSTLRKCDIIIPAVTSFDGKQIYGAGKTYQIPYISK